MASKRKRRNWLDLPSRVTTNILSRIGIPNILENAQLVCTAWYKICKDPAMWTVINTKDLLSSRSKLSPENMLKQAVDRSQGQLLDLTLVRGLDCRLFLYITDRSSQLRRLEMVSGIYEGCLTTHAMMKFPLLEELNLYAVNISEEVIETLGRYCPMLKTLKVNQKISTFPVFPTTCKEGYLEARAIAIGRNLPELRHLELIGNGMTNIGLQVILDNCRRLETLDLRACSNIEYLNGFLRKNYSKRIKNLKLSHVNDGLESSPYFLEIVMGLFADYGPPGDLLD